MSSHFLYGAVSTLFLGGTVCLLKKFSPAKAKEWLCRESISVLYTVPTMTDALARIEGFPDSPVKIISSGADWPAESKKKLAFIMHIDLSQAAFMSLAYVPGDLIKAAVSAFLAIKITQALSLSDTMFTKGG